MPIVTVYGAPDSATQDALRFTLSDIITAILDVVELGLDGDRSRVTVFFPADRLRGNSEVVYVRVDQFDKPERVEPVRQRVASVVRDAIAGRFPHSKVEVRVEPFERADGYASYTPVRLDA